MQAFYFPEYSMCSKQAYTFACGSTFLPKIYNKSEIASLERQNFQNFFAYYWGIW